MFGKLSERLEVVQVHFPCVCAHVLLCVLVCVCVYGFYGGVNI